MKKPVAHIATWSSIKLFQAPRRRSSVLFSDLNSMYILLFWKFNITRCKPGFLTQILQENISMDERANVYID